jgi:hypothetical protein
LARAADAAASDRAVAGFLREATMTEFERYVVEEHVEDFNDNLISRRELLRRVSLVTGSLAAAVTTVRNATRVAHA